GRDRLAIAHVRLKPKNRPMLAKRLKIPWRELPARVIRICAMAGGAFTSHLNTMKILRFFRKVMALFFDTLLVEFLSLHFVDETI
ncbi:MAG: hypothetical protein OXC66_00565, partial [Roseovarius sp.]|nr:hypothetical protein [Roseovarius sp.]